MTRLPFLCQNVSMSDFTPRSGNPELFANAGKETIWNSAQKWKSRAIAESFGCIFDGSDEDFRLYLASWEKKWVDGGDTDYPCTDGEPFRQQFPLRGVIFQCMPLPSIWNAVSYYNIREQRIPTVQIGAACLPPGAAFQAKLTRHTIVPTPCPECRTVVGTDVCVSVVNQHTANMQTLYGCPPLHTDVTLLRVHVLRDRSSHSGMVALIPIKNKFLLNPLLHPKQAQSGFYQHPWDPFRVKQSLTQALGMVPHVSRPQLEEFFAGCIQLLRYVYFGNISRD